MGETEIYIYIKKSLDKWTGWREVYLFIYFFKTESEKKQWAQIVFLQGQGNADCTFQDATPCSRYRTRQGTDSETASFNAPSRSGRYQRATLQK